MSKISSEGLYSIAEIWKYFFAFGIDDEEKWFGLAERSRFGKAAQK